MRLFPSRAGKTGAPLVEVQPNGRRRCPCDGNQEASGGLRVLLGAQQEMEDRGGAMKVIHVNPQIMQIFDMVGFLDILTVE